MHVHFWAPDTEPAQLAVWQPDSEPTLFPDGKGHAFLELAVRLRASGATVTLGPECDQRALVVVVFSKDLGYRESLRLIREVTPKPILLIESDWSPRFVIPVQPALSVVAMPGPPNSARARWVPLLPQRGMIRRKTGRRGMVNAIGYKGDPKQLPKFVREDWFQTCLNQLGVRFRTNDLWEGPSGWHDFSDSDLILCMRDSEIPTDHKPPTKLINAWAAGCIPIVGPEPAYAALATDGKDAVFADGPEAVLDAVKRLVRSQEFTERIEAGVAERQAEYSPERVLGAWQEAIADAPDGIIGSDRWLALMRQLTWWARAQVHNARSRQRKGD